MGDFEANITRTPLGHALRLKSDAANEAIAAHRRKTAAAYLGLVIQEIGLNNFPEEVALYFKPFTVQERFRHPLTALRWSEAIRHLGGFGATKVYLDEPGSALRQPVLLAREHYPAIWLPDGRYALPNGQITEIAENSTGGSPTMPHIMPFEAYDSFSKILEPNNQTSREAHAWSRLRGTGLYAPAVEITGRTAGENTSKSCLYVNALLPLVAEDCRPPLPGILEGYIEQG